MSAKVANAVASIATAAAIRDTEQFFRALDRILLDTRNVPLADLPESVRMLRVVLSIQDAIMLHQFKVGGGSKEKGEQMIAWAGDGAGLFAVDASRFCRHIGADAFARHLDRLIALYPGGKLPSSLEKLRRAGDRIAAAAVSSVHKGHVAAIWDLSTALRQWIGNNQTEIARAIGATGATTNRTRSFAREIASAYDGKVRRKELAWDEGTLCEYLVSGSYGGRSLAFRVFDGGCIAEGATMRKPAIGIAFNCPIERIDRRIREIPSGAMPVFRFRYYKGGKELDPPDADALREQLQALWDDDRSRAALTGLRLAPNEPLLLLEQPMFGKGYPQFYLVHRSTDLADLCRRLDLLAAVFPPVPNARAARGR